jgi:hypothetical protein
MTTQAMAERRRPDEDEGADPDIGGLAALGAGSSRAMRAARRPETGAVGAGG